MSAPRAAVAACAIRALCASVAAGQGGGAFPSAAPPIDPLPDLRRWDTESRLAAAK